jgi:hypothetical protein
MFAPRLTKSQTETAARPTANLGRHRSTRVGGFPADRHANGIIAQGQEARRSRYPEHVSLIQETAGASWDFSKIPIFPPNQQRASASPLSPASTSRIKVETFGLGPLVSESAHSLTQRDGSPDDLAVMSDDQDALTSDVFEAGRTGRGVHIRVSGGNPAGTPDFPDGLRWVQTLDTNAPLFGQSPPYVDFAPPKDDKPFYFADGRENATFSDNPSRGANGVVWDATLSLTGVKGRTITRLDSVNYGFAIDTSGTLSLHQPRATGVIDLVIHGDTLRSEYPNWVFSGGFAVPQVPGGAVTGGTETA